MEDKSKVMGSINTIGQYHTYLTQKKKDLENEIKKVKVKALFSSRILIELMNLPFDA